MEAMFRLSKLTLVAAILIAVVIFLSTCMLTDTFQATPISSNNVTEETSPACAPKNNMLSGSRASPGFNFTGVCGEQNFKCVISYVIWGDHPKYTTGAIRNTMLAKDVYPGWIPRFYYDEATVPKETLQELEKLKAELIPISKMNGVTGIATRFLVADDDTVDRYIVRDVDSRLNLREKAAVDEWIKSGYSIHILRDHPNHQREMNGGMWGGVKGAAGNLTEIMHSIQMDYGLYNADQDFLCKYIYPAIEKDQIAHDSTTCTMFPNSVSFPTNRIGYEHVGQMFSETDKPRWEDINCCFLAWQAPVQCRRRPEWTKG